LFIFSAFVFILEHNQDFGQLCWGEESRAVLAGKPFLFLKQGTMELFIKKW